MIILHKVLVNGSFIVSSTTMPLGFLSEETQGAMNEIFRQYQLNRSRKILRKKTNEDVIHRMFAHSDPLINTFRRVPKVRSDSSYGNDVELMSLMMRADIEYIEN